MDVNLSNSVGALQSYKKSGTSCILYLTQHKFGTASFQGLWNCKRVNLIINDSVSKVMEFLPCYFSFDYLENVLISIWHEDCWKCVKLPVHIE